MVKNIKRGEVYTCTLPKDPGSVQAGTRPVVIVQNDIGNYFSPTTLVAPLTSKLDKHKLPTHMFLSCKQHPKLTKDSLVLLEQIKTVDKSLLRQKMFELTEEEMAELDDCIKISFALN